MTGFKAKNIKSVSSLGEQLNQQRILLGLSLDTVATRTKISVKYLKALEAGAYEKLPGTVYARNFIRAYGTVLGLSNEALISQYQAEQKIFSKIRQDQQQARDIGKPVEKVSRFRLIVTPRLLRQLLIIVLAVACIVYLGYKIQAIFAPPLLVVAAPVEDTVIEQNSIKIVGRTEIGAVIKINGQQVLIDEDGNFSESLSLQEGSNIIEITAQKKHSKIAQVYRKVVVIAAQN